VSTPFWTCGRRGRWDVGKWDVAVIVCGLVIRAGEEEVELATYMVGRTI
jgi:hypothetical protein